MSNKNNTLVMDRHAIFISTPPLPTNMLIELANICNHQCIFCNYKDMKRKKRICDKEFTKKIIREAYSEGVREIGFYMMGEPFVYQDLEEIVSFSKETGFSYIYLTSNGVLATPERLRKLIDAGLDSIKFSINAVTRETYKKIHGKDDFLTVKENLKWLRDYLDESGKELKTFISFIKCNCNREETGLLHEYFDKLVDKIYVFECINTGGRMTSLMETGVAEEFVSPSVPCSMVFNRLHVTVEGFLDACCSDADGMLVTADLHKMSLRDAWNSEAMVNLRLQHLSGKFGNNLCRNCIQNVDAEIKPLVKI